eukprot:s43_g11.t1
MADDDEPLQIITSHPSEVDTGQAGKGRQEGASISGYAASWPTGKGNRKAKGNKNRLAPYEVDRPGAGRLDDPREEPLEIIERQSMHDGSGVDDAGEALLEIMGLDPTAAPEQDQISSGSIDGTFRSLFIALTKLQDIVPHQKLAQTMLVRGTAFSTYFTGMGSVEVAADMVNSAVKAVFVSSAHKSVGACECDKRLQSLLKGRVESCIFEDILAFVPSLTWEEVRDLSPEQRFAKVRAHFRPEGRHRCSRHGSWCQCVRSDFDFSGSPCQPYSARGKQLGLADQRSLLFFVWMVILLHYRPTIAIHECTPRFFTSLLDQFMAQYYYIHHLNTSPEAFGWTCIRRERVFSILVLKERTQILGNIPDVYTEICRQIRSRQPGFPISSLLTANEMSLLEEENCCRRKRKLALLRRKSDDWSYLLTPKQKDYVAKYNELWWDQVKTDPQLDSGCVYDLSQNPAFCKVWSGQERRLPTLRKAGYILWAPRLRRWLIREEIALAHGFPVTETTARASQTPVRVTRFYQSCAGGGHPPRLLLGHCWTSFASSRSLWALPGFICQWALPDLNREALPDLNCERQISVGTAGPQQRGPDPSGHCRTSTASARSQWALPS